jgi:regulatory protein
VVPNRSYENFLVLGTLKSSLYNQAVRFLARRAHSREELRRKLLRKATTDEITSVLDRLEDLGYLDDQEFAWLRARSQRTSKHWGNRRVRLDLKSRGLDARIVELTLSRLEAELPEVDGLRHLTQSWIQRFGSPTTVTQLKKLFDRCLRLGYAPEKVRRELEEYFGTLDWR